MRQYDTGTFTFQNLNKDLAYLTGAYLSDGAIYANKNGWMQFTLEVIDEDFAQGVQDAINHLVGVQRPIYVSVARSGNAEKVYKAYSGNQELCKWLTEQTQNKTLIPQLILDTQPEIAKAFVAGVLDGDGFVCKGKPTEKTGSKGQIIIGIVCADLWLYEFAELVQKLGAQIGKITRKNVNSPSARKAQYGFTFNKQQFKNAGLYFRIARKRERIANWFRSSETRRETPQVGEVIVQPT